MEPGRSRTERPTTRRETATRQFLIMSDHALLHSHHYLVSSFPPLPPPMGWRRKLGVRTGASSGVAGNGLYVCYEIPGIPRVPGLVDFLFPLSRKKRTLLCGHDLICPNSYPRRRSISLVLCNPPSPHLKLYRLVNRSELIAMRICCLSPGPCRWRPYALFRIVDGVPALPAAPPLVRLTELTLGRTQPYSFTIDPAIRAASQLPVTPMCGARGGRGRLYFYRHPLRLLSSPSAIPVSTSSGSMSSLNQ